MGQVLGYMTIKPCGHVLQPGGHVTLQWGGHVTMHLGIVTIMIIIIIMMMMQLPVRHVTLQQLRHAACRFAPKRRAATVTVTAIVTETVTVNVTVQRHWQTARPGGSVEAWGIQVDGDGSMWV